MRTVCIHLSVGKRTVGRMKALRLHSQQTGHRQGWRGWGSLRLGGDKEPQKAGAAKLASAVKVKRSMFLGDLTQVHVEWAGRELVIRQTTAPPCGEGETAYLMIDPSHCVLLEGD